MAEQRFGKDKKEKIESDFGDVVEIKEGEPCEIVGINFREAGKIYYFSPGNIKLSVGDRAIVGTSRGIEIGTVKVANKIGRAHV